MDEGRKGYSGEGGKECAHEQVVTAGSLDATPLWPLCGLSCFHCSKLVRELV